MDYTSTRGAAPATSLDAALIAGLAPDGGLYVPARLPEFQSSDFRGCQTLPQVASHLLQPFFQGSRLRGELADIAAEALELPIELRPLQEGLGVMELFHGPTAAFKDFAARFLATCMARLQPTAAPPTTVLVATSGDTGAAVAAAFHRRAGFRVVILYPDGRVSPRQAHHLGAFADNVRAVAVRGNFDDCQALVKQAFADQALRQQVPLASANSISLGRLLPQISYYAWMALQLQRQGDAAPHLIIPSGNLGNALAAILARRMGLPIARVSLATNANPTLHDFFSGQPYNGRPSIATLANAMDVGAPSNFERLLHFQQAHVLREEIECVRVNDAQIRDSIASTWQRWGYASCPHTACALAAAEQLQQHPPARWVVATAHPAKFPEVVEPILGQPVAAPPALETWLRKPSHSEVMDNDYGMLCQTLRQGIE